MSKPITVDHSRDPKWWDDSLPLDLLRQREKDFKDGQMALSKKQAENALQRFRDRAKGIDRNRKYFNEESIATTPALLAEIAKRAGIKTWFEKSEIEALRRSQDDWDELDVIFRQNTPVGIAARWTGQRTAFEGCSADELTTFEILSIEEMRLQASDKRRLLRHHYTELTHRVIPFVCEIFARISAACEKVAGQLEVQEKSLAASVGFSGRPSQLLIATTQTGWRYRDSLAEIGIFPTSPKSFLRAVPGGEELFFN